MMEGKITTVIFLVVCIGLANCEQQNKPFQNAIALWQQNRCIFPDSSAYKGQNKDLEICEKLLDNPDKEYIVYQNICKEFIDLSMNICNNSWEFSMSHLRVDQVQLFFTTNPTFQNGSIICQTLNSLPENVKIQSPELILKQRETCPRICSIPQFLPVCKLQVFVLLHSSELFAGAPAGAAANAGPTTKVEDGTGKVGTPNTDKDSGASPPGDIAGAKNDKNVMPPSGDKGSTLTPGNGSTNGPVLVSQPPTNQTEGKKNETGSGILPGVTVKPTQSMSSSKPTDKTLKDIITSPTTKIPSTQTPFQAPPASPQGSPGDIAPVKNDSVPTQPSNLSRNGSNPTSPGNVPPLNIPDEKAKPSNVPAVNSDKVEKDKNQPLNNTGASQNGPQASQNGSSSEGDKTKPAINGTSKTTTETKPEDGVDVVEIEGSDEKNEMEGPKGEFDFETTTLPTTPQDKDKNYLNFDTKGKDVDQPADKDSSKEQNFGGPSISNLENNYKVPTGPGIGAEPPVSGHFFAYFLTAVVICISGYVIFHNKQKIIAFVVEGRNGKNGGRRRSGNVKYSELKSNVEEVMPSLETAATAKNFVY